MGVPGPQLRLVSDTTDQPLVQVFLHYLKAEGAHCVFGIPGGLLHPFFDAVEQDPDLQLIVSKHEEGAAFMADGFARAGHRGLAVCAATSGPGATNLMTGVSCAYADGVPMLVITGQANSKALGRGAAQETPPEDIDVVSMFRPITKYSAMVTAPERFPHHLRRALRAAFMGRPGPVHLNVPVDFWAQTVSERWFEPDSYRPHSQPFDRLSVQRATEVLMSARRPVILAGSGVVSSGAQQHLRELAELLGARVATTPRAKGCLPEDHPLSMGVFGFAGHRAARETILSDDVDVLLTVGASLNETTTLNWNPALQPAKALLQLDIDPERIGRNYPVDVALVGDAQTILIELMFHVHRAIGRGRELRSGWANEPAPLREYLNEALRVSQQTPVTPQRWRVDLQEVLPDDAIIYSDIGGHMLFNLHHLQIRERQQFILNLGFGSMGHGTVAPIGTALANPLRPVFAIVGDGCFTMNGMELLTAVEYKVPVIWIVENNQMHGITWHGSQTVGSKNPLTSVRYRQPLQLDSLARAMGLNVWVVDSPGEIQGAVERALQTGGPCLIEVRADGSISPPLGDRAKTIAGFTKK